MVKSLVSIIIPIFNRFELAHQTIQSVYKQTHRPIELILVDDCSDMPYKPQINSEPGFEVILLRHAENKGPGASRETGRQAATGDFIAYLDSDDLWHPEKLEKQVATLRENPNTGMCYCTSLEFSKWPLCGKEKIRKRSDQAYREFLPTVLSGRPWGTGACLWTKDAIDKIGPWLSSFAWEDSEYECRAGCKDIQITSISEVLSYYRKNSGQKQLSGKLTYRQMNTWIISITQMMKNLKYFGKLDNQDVRLAFSKKVFRHVPPLFEANQKKLGLEALSVLFHSSSGIRKLLFFSLNSAGHVLSSTTLKRLCYKMRNYI